ncbi:precorrin-4 C(11)-methyltransferase [Paludicola sp. MB14-C6]|uniref:precorrin-4 C(11)-methyltransferase n=1 Tax=Paludihabitans sp. MB14-C6 TaxID=3070656 RepID=UPI0027DBFDE6|nr:precorrin-4 C(11)-methyltransferase [Paludicola sp. MB14-C6]WMJ22032.1 precorrin-4 C(11)-methyltransferase [Paludicola sp. MB14-C6]
MVYFIGAGPGAVDLITVRGKQKLEEADVVIYAGSLVNPELLTYTKSNCEIYNSAKMTLEEVIDVMVKAEKENKMTVRLHTGDPCIYGAIREQMDLLDGYDIEYTVVPGVSSFIGAASALKAEFTLPDVSQTVILTRMAGRTPVPEKEDIEKLASHNATMVVFLTSTMLGELSKRLIDGGYKEDTPAAIVYKATWPDEKVIITTVKDIEKAALDNDIHKMALIMVGGFLGDRYSRSKLYDKYFTHEFREAVKCE